MREDSLIRVAFIVSNGQTETFKSSLLKLIIAVLFENNNKPLNSHMISALIKDNYELDFLPEEIEQTINDKRDNGISVNQHHGKTDFSLTFEKHDILKKSRC